MFWFGLVCSLLAIGLSQIASVLNKKLLSFAPITSSNTVGRSVEQFKKQEQTVSAFRIAGVIFATIGAITLCVCLASWFSGV